MIKHHRKMNWLSIILTILLSAVVAHADVTIDESSDQFSTGIGDYSVVFGNGVASSPGQVVEVLGGSLGGDAELHTNGSEYGTYSTNMSNLYDTLYAGGVSSTSLLAFGFGLNESGKIGDNYIEIDSLDMTFNRAANPAKSFSLGTDKITVFNYMQGASTAESVVVVDLGFDFMQEYRSTSTEQFTISSKISNTSDGGEIYFLSTEYTAAVVPEPASTALFLFGGATLGFVRFRKKAA